LIRIGLEVFIKKDGIAIFSGFLLQVNFRTSVNILSRWS
jgi:hypothetical protein